MDLQDKKVIYVGGFGGIGYTSCKCFLQNGIKSLAILDLKEDAEMLQTLRKTSKTATVHYIQIDLTDGQQSIEAAFAKAQAVLGRLDVVVNGSGIMNEQEIERTVKVNLLGVIYSTFAAMRYMDKSQGGNGGLIVNISSLVGLDAYGSYAVYTATKYGVNGLGRALANPFYYEQTQIKFITICPSTTDTPMLAELRQNPVTTFGCEIPLPPLLCNNQSAEKCGQNLVEITRMGQNGSIWILCNGGYKEYKYPEIEVL